MGSQIEEMMSKLKKENYELRNERNDIRKERDALQTQLKKAKDKVKLLEASVGDDEDLLKQLYAARKEAKSQRRQKRNLQAEALKLIESQSEDTNAPEALSSTIFSS